MGEDRDTVLWRVATGGGGCARATAMSVRGVTKLFPGTMALDGVGFELRPGSVHALVGQNGSGKSTLIKILAGYHAAEPGSELRIDGDRIDLAVAGRARHDALRFVHQELGLFLDLSAIENIALRSSFRRRGPGLVAWRQQEELTRELLARFELDLDPRAPLGGATPVQRTVVAIASALVGLQEGSGILVLDEPTAVLPPHEAGQLLGTIDRLRAAGTAIVLVSHRLDEVIETADDVTVLRSGRAVHTRAVEGLTTQALAELMVGDEVDAHFRLARSPMPDTSVALSATDLRGTHLAGVDVEVERGEILGVAGLPGSGHDELPYALAGFVSGGSGRVRVEGDPWTDVRRSPRLGIPIVPADRAREAVIGDFSVRVNLTLGILGHLGRRGWLRDRLDRRAAHCWQRDLSIQAASVEDCITTLSGGNQQKVIIARCLARGPRALVMCEPTAGVDVGTRQAIYELIGQRADAGLAVVVASSDIGDLLAMCSRILVMRDGRISHELRGSDITERSLVRAMEGAGVADEPR